MTLKDKSNDSNFSTTITFTCHSCEITITAPASEIGKIKVCSECDSENEVPLPRLKVGGGRRTAAQNMHTGQVPDEKINETVKSKNIKQEKTINTSDTNRTTREELYVNNQDLNNDYVEDKDNKRFIPIVALLVVSILIGWTVMNWGTGIYAKLTGSSSMVITQPEKVPTQIGPAQLESILGFWKAAHIANETIETDLKISLAEMEKLGMVDQANAVRRAIEKKYDSIAESRNRYVAVMADLATAYQIQPSEVETLFDNFASTQAVRSDPKGTVFLELSLDGIKKIPSDQSSYKNHFGQIFGISEEGVITDIE